MSQLRLAEGRDSRLVRLVARGGTAVHLVPDTILVAHDIVNNLRAATQAYIARQELGDAVRLAKEGSRCCRPCRTAGPPPPPSSVSAASRPSRPAWPTSPAPAAGRRDWMMEASESSTRRTLT